MEREEYHSFTVRLTERLARDERVLGLVALGSMSGEPPAPDAWSDHDFFVICRPGEEERLRTELSWLPDADSLAFSYRETAHGVKALYRSGHLLEFAVFLPDELQLARVNRYRTLLDRGGIEERMRALRERTSASPPPDRRWLFGQFLTALLVSAGRFRRGERLSGRALLQGAAAHLVRLLVQTPEDSLDPLRRFEQASAGLGRELDTALSLPPPEAALLLVQVARRMPDFPEAAARAVEQQLR